MACESERPRAPRPPTAGRYLVLAGETPVYASPGGEEVGRLHFGEEIERGLEDGGWVRYQLEGSSRWVPRASVESERERETRERETREVLALPSHPAALAADAILSWWPRADSPRLGELAQGTRVKVYTAEGDYYAIELAEPGSDRRYVGYVLSELVELEPVPRAAAPPSARGIPAQIVETGYEDAADAGDGLETAGPPDGSTRPLARPALVERADPVYPLAARRAGAGGLVRLRVLVGVRGTVENIEVLSSPRPDLEAAALRAVRTWRYRPAEQDGSPIATWEEVEIAFEP